VNAVKGRKVSIMLALLFRWLEVFKGCYHFTVRPEETAKRSSEKVLKGLILSV
jgi:hypothetical protein